MMMGTIRDMDTTVGRREEMYFSPAQLRYLEDKFQRVVFPHDTHKSKLIHYNGQQSVLEEIRRLISRQGDGPYVEVFLRFKGEPLDDLGLWYKAWDEFIELQVMDREAWVRNTAAWIEDEDSRIEFRVIVDDRIVGGVLMSEGYDPHVGRCFSLIAAYIEPEYRNTAGLLCYRRAFALARVMGYPMMAYTHRLGDWRYETVYRRTSREEKRN